MCGGSGSCKESCKRAPLDTEAMLRQLTSFDAICIWCWTKLGGASDDDDLNTCYFHAIFFKTFSLLICFSIFYPSNFLFWIKSLKFHSYPLLFLIRLIILSFLFITDEHEVDVIGYGGASDDDHSSIRSGTSDGGVTVTTWRQLTIGEDAWKTVNTYSHCCTYSNSGILDSTLLAD